MDTKRKGFPFASKLFQIALVAAGACVNRKSCSPYLSYGEMLKTVSLDGGMQATYAEVRSGAIGMKIAAILGTCPEAIKLAPIIRELRSHPQTECHVCVTDQRQQEVDGILEGFEIIPDSSLDLTAPGLSLSGLTSVAMTMLDAFLRRETPHVVILEGASTVTLAAALAAFYRNIPIMHIESDYLTGDMGAQWPHDANRVLISRLAELHFAPTPGSRRNLLTERVSPESVIVSGSTMLDSLYYAVDHVRRFPPVIPGMPPIAESNSQLPLVLIAGHGHEGFEESLESLCSGVAEVADSFPEAQFVYSINLSPNVRNLAQQYFAGRRNVHVIPRAPYFAFVALMDMARVVLTDSRGVLRAARALGKPVLALPEESSLTAHRRDRIISEASRLLSNVWYRRSSHKLKLSGVEGHAAARIVRAIQLRYARSASWKMSADPVAASNRDFAS
jgi:UDP-N-acetylglucosamine 2-epimerase (non-hydrolysing)